MKQYLLLTDVDAIQSYVFSSVRMSTIVGASQLIRESDSLFATMAAALINDKGKSTLELGVCHGGGGLFVFNCLEQARIFERDVANEFNKLSINGSLSTSGIHEFDSDNGQSFLLARESALVGLENRKRLGRNSRENPELGWAWNCETCGAGSATEVISRNFDLESDDQTSVGRNEWRVCPACNARYRHRRIGEQRQREFYNEESQENLEIPFNLEKLAGGSQWALVVLDGDGLGQRLREFDSPERYQDFSNGLKKLLEDALRTALQSLQKLHQNETAPALVLFDGGDDIVIACPAELAFPFVESFSNHVQAAFQKGCKWANNTEVGFSAGVVVMHSGFPFQTAHRIANGLLRNAKTRAREKNWKEGAVDFVVITEAFGDSERILSERIIEDKFGTTTIRLSGRPYRLNNDEERSLGRLKEACRLLKQNSFPNNRLLDLRNNLNRTAIVGTIPHESAVTVNDICEENVKPFVANWEQRVSRVPLNQATWNAAMEHLNGFDSTEFPHSDLTDAIYLWEKTIDN